MKNIILTSNYTARLFASKAEAEKYAQLYVPEVSSPEIVRIVKNNRTIGFGIYMLNQLNEKHAKLFELRQI